MPKIDLSKAPEASNPYMQEELPVIDKEAAKAKGVANERLATDEKQTKAERHIAWFLEAMRSNLSKLARPDITESEQQAINERIGQIITIYHCDMKNLPCETDAYLALMLENLSDTYTDSNGAAPAPGKINNLWILMNAYVKSDGRASSVGGHYLDAHIRLAGTEPDAIHFLEKNKEDPTIIRAAATNVVYGLIYATAMGPSSTILSTLSELPANLQTLIWHGARSKNQIRMGSDIDKREVGQGPSLLAQLAQTHGDKSKIDRLNEALENIKSSSMPFINKAALLNEAMHTRSPQIARALKALITERMRSLGAEEPREVFGVIAQKLGEMSYNADNKQARVIMAIEYILVEHKDASSRLSALQAALSDDNSELYKALNVKRWTGFTSGQTGSYLSIKSAVDGYVATLASNTRAVSDDSGEDARDPEHDTSLHM